MRLTRFLFFVLAVLAAGWVQPARAELRLALVIGDAAYGDAPLSAPLTDARAMAKALRSVGFEVIQRENLTKSEMEDAIDSFNGRLTPDAVGVFYYSGRGLQVDGKNYLVPVDAEISSKGSIPANTVEVKAVADDLAATRSRVRLVILDACRDDPIRHRVPGLSAGLAAMTVPPATVVALAAAPGQIAGDDGRYVAELTKAMKTPGLPVVQVFQQVQAAVSAATGQAQVPWVASSLAEPFTFVDAPTVAVTEAPPAAPVRPPAPPLVTGAEAVELALWLSIKDSKDAAAFQDYLARYPAGRFVVLARNSLRVLTQKTALLVQVPPQPVPVFQPPLPVQDLYRAASPAAQQQYDLARGLLRQGSAAQAEAAFRQFLAANHDSPLADNAQYWLGESLYVRGRFADAAAVFTEGLATYPKSPRAPESLLKLGLSQLALARLDSSGRMDIQRKAEACKTFAAVGVRFPESPEAVKAKSRRTQLHCTVDAK
jgi:tol-pal system protein YbgF